MLAFAMTSFSDPLRSPADLRQAGADGALHLLTEAEALQAALEIAHTGAWGWDEITRTKLWPAQTKAIFGLPPTVEMTRELFVSMLHPDDVAVYRAAWAAAIDPDGPQIYQATYRIRRAHDGEERWISSRARVTFVDRMPVRVFGAMRDITEDRITLERLRTAETELRALNGALEDRVRQEIEAREAVQASLARAENLAALGRLAAGIAHDFNNMLQIILGATSVIAQRPHETEKVARYAGVIEGTAERGASVTARLLAFARQAELRAEALDLRPLLTGLRDVVSHSMGDAMSLRLDLAPELPPVLADKGQLETVLINLAANARDAMAAAGEITLSSALDRVGPDHRTGLPPGWYLRLSVADTGHGMDPATLAHAAEPFFTTKAVGKGTGLGLAMARGFAEQSGGRMVIESRPGQGTTVTLWLPAADSTAAPCAVEVAETASPVFSRRLCALLVDDEDTVRDVLADQLTLCDIEVIKIADAQAALVRLQQPDRLDVLITDYSMPGMNGVSLIKEAKHLCPRLPMILLSGYAGNSAIRSLMHEADPSIIFLNKPITGLRLAQHITGLVAA
jgi:signal transduction histidine kinase/CheY-like chemotaxis protein